jgi:hypothetical protein
MAFLNDSLRFHTTSQYYHNTRRPVEIENIEYFGDSEDIEDIERDIAFYEDAIINLENENRIAQDFLDQLVIDERVSKKLKGNLDSELKCLMDDDGLKVLVFYY